MRTVAAKVLVGTVVAAIGVAFFSLMFGWLAGVIITAIWGVLWYLRERRIIR
jgi:hypothetical protein